MKHTLTAVAILSLAMAGSASAATVWQGDLFITKATGCSGAKPPVAAPVNVGYFGQAIYVPASVTGTAKTDRLAVFDINNEAMQIQPTTPGSLDTAASVYQTNIGHEGGARYKVIQNSTSPFFTISPKPAQINSNTQAITITATPQGFDGITGCNVTIRGVLYPRPDSLAN